MPVSILATRVFILLCQPVFSLFNQITAVKKKKNRFQHFITTPIGAQFREAYEYLQGQVDQSSIGPLNQNIEEVGGGIYGIKLQNAITHQVEKYRAEKLDERFQQLPNNDRRKLCHQNRTSGTSAPITTIPTIDTVVPQHLYSIIISQITGAINPLFRQKAHYNLGNTGKKVGVHGDGAGAAPIPGGFKWICHTTLLREIVSRMKDLKIVTQMEAYGFFAALCQVPREPTAFNNNNEDNGESQVLIPDIVCLHNGQTFMYELKRICSILKCPTNGQLPSEINDWYKHPQNRFISAADKRERRIPIDYNTKIREAQQRINDPSNALVEAFNQIPEVIGLAVGAIGELSQNFNTLINFCATVGSENCFESFGASNPMAAKGKIAWYLKRRWNRIAVISAAQLKVNGLRYAGLGTAQAQAATIHQQQNQQQPHT